MGRSPIFLAVGDRHPQVGTLHPQRRQLEHRIRQYNMISELAGCTDIDEWIGSAPVTDNDALLPLA